MTDLNKLFFCYDELDNRKATDITTEALHSMDDGELYLEYSMSESIAFDDQKIRNISHDTHSGFGLRGIKGEMCAYAHSSEISARELKRAAQVVKAISDSTTSEHYNVKLAPKAPLCYSDYNPLTSATLQTKISLLQKLDQYLRNKDSRVKQVSCSLFTEWEAIQIIRVNGELKQDVRPLVRFNVTVYVEQNGRMEAGSYGIGGRNSYNTYIDEQKLYLYADEALRQSLVKLSSIEAPAGELTVVLGSGWPGILLHEAVGHGLEGDFNYKKTSAFSNLIGQQVASPGVTVIDNGTIANQRGSLNIDDEGTPTQETILIENGILKGYMQDRLNARLMGHNLTGNGRRESYEYPPLPRMTNTYMLGGNSSPEEIIQSVKYGVYAVNFSGGQVDITSGKFVFSASEAYLIEDGKITAPIKGATLIGNGPETMKKVSAIGNDMKLDQGTGTCGKDGQSVPVCVGQPTLLIEKMTVGGTRA